MANYKVRLREDLDRWIAEGLVPAASREPILAQVAEPRRLEASAALAVVGGLLAGIAVIAFVAANWNGIPRLGRFGLILGLFLAICGAAAWCAERRPLARNVLLLVAALVFAAGIGLTGQIFDIAGDPKAALRAAGLGAVLLAVAGRSSAALVAALAFLAIADMRFEIFGPSRGPPPWLIFVAPLGVVLAWVWRSKPLAHAAAMALPLAGVFMLAWAHFDAPDNVDGFVLSILFGGLAAAARWLERRRDHPLGGIFYGWWVWAALGFFALSGFGPNPPVELAHRVIWLALSGAAAALGLYDRRPAITAAGAVSLAAAIAAILFDLGLGLMAAAGVFALVAVLALAGGFALRRRAAT